MYKHCDKAQDFIDLWCAKLQLPTVWVKFDAVDRMRRPGAICADGSTIILWERHIESRGKFVKVLLHELSHWLLYWRYKDNRYMAERQVIKITDCLLKEYYPSYWRKNA